ncbi:MAG TPA: PadR family transcriptional regulator [Sphingomicrobium sp.]|nr:PadR family transcriptional regulator [Sphingomicrobium sp.]
MTRSRRLSPQTLVVLEALANRPSDWLYGLELANLTGLKSGSLYPILIRLADRALVESRWLEPSERGRPPRHAYRISAAGLEALAKAERGPNKSLRELRT